MTPYRTRFAPSPTGELHLGHAYSAWVAWQAASCNPSHFVLRIDDLDFTRCHDHFRQSQIDDLHWLGLSWEAAPLLQSARMDRYQQALDYLQDEGLIYPCYLTRREVDAILSAPQETSLKDALSDKELSDRAQKGTKAAWRLDTAQLKQRSLPTSWHDMSDGTQPLSLDAMGDVVIARRDIGASYHLSVVLDDFDSEITLVTRGADLMAETPVQILLHHLLDLPVPHYAHHALVRDDTGKRLAKRDDARALKTYRDQGESPENVINLSQSLAK